MAPPRVVLTELATADLDAVFDFLFDAASPEITNLVIARLIETMRRASWRPSWYRERPEYPGRPRRINSGNYAILYEPLIAGDGILILRVLHGHQDIPRYAG